MSVHRCLPPGIDCQICLPVSWSYKYYHSYLLDEFSNFASSIAHLDIMQALFQPPIFLSHPPPICQWHWVVPQPTIFLQTPYITAPAPQPLVLYQQLQAQPAHRIGLALRVILHGRGRAGYGQGFWALALEAVYTHPPGKTTLRQDVTRWTAQHGVLPDNGAWTGELYIVKTGGVGVHVDREASCVVVPAEDVLRVVRISMGSGEEDAVKEAMEEAREKGARMVLVVDVDAVPEGIQQEGHGELEE